jgi:hypothetical protein
VAEPIMLILGTYAGVVLLLAIACWMEKWL